MAASSVVLAFSLWTAITVTAQTTVGGNTPDNSSMLDVQSTSKGVLFPRMTTTQRDAIEHPATSLMIFNTTTICLEINLGTEEEPDWAPISCNEGSIAALDCDNADLGGLLVADEAIDGISLSVAYTGGTAGSHDGDLAVSTGVTGITATLAAGSFNAGSGTLTYELSGMFSGEGTAGFPLSIGGQSCTVSLDVPTSVQCGAYIAPGVWKDFMCYNLGAVNTAADPFTPSWEIIGDYWQWGKKDKAASGPSGPSAGEANAAVPVGWSNTAASAGAWSAAEKTAQDPCPEGYRVPTLAQWQGVIDNNEFTEQGTWTESMTNYSSGGTFGDHLFLPATGYRAFANFPSNPNGTLTERGSVGFYWSAETFDFQGNLAARALLVSNEGNPTANYPGVLIAGFSVRCITE